MKKTILLMTISILTIISLLFFSCSDNSNTSDKFIGKWQAIAGTGQKTYLGEIDNNYKFIISKADEESVMVKHHNEGTYFHVIFSAGNWDDVMGKSIYELTDSKTLFDGETSHLYYLESSGHLMDNTNKEYEKVQ